MAGLDSWTGPRRWWDEARFCLALGAGPTDRLRLLKSTLSFHLANHLPLPRGESAVAGARRHRVRLGDRVESLWLRPRTGDWFVLHEVLRLGTYRLPRSITDGVEYVVDLGANIGLTALWYARAMPAARLACVEPGRDNAALLRRNVGWLGERVTVVEAAVGPSRGTAEFLEAETWGGRLAPVGAGRRGYPVELLDVPAILERARFPRIDLLKLDIEGAERELLGSGDRSWLRGVRALIIELHGDYTLEALARDLAPHGLEVRGPGPEHPMIVATRR